MNSRLPFTSLLAAALLASNCASLHLPSHDDLEVVTDPPGAIATCGKASTVTPGTLRIPREKTPAVLVRVEMEGYWPRELQIARNRDVPLRPWGIGIGLVVAAAWRRRRSGPKQRRGLSDGAAQE